jgi:gliding motility-associated-like protein
MYVMKNFLMLISSIFFCFQCNAQHEYDVWYFGNGAGISFHTSSPTALINSHLGTLESSSGVCDKNGNLLFYTNGDSIINKNHVLLSNGMFNPGVSANPLFSSSRQGTMVLPVPNDPGKYYIFMNADQEYGSSGALYTSYSVVDMNLDNGNGAVIVKNNHIWDKSPSSTEEAMAIGQHANGVDYWILTPMSFLSFPSGGSAGYKITRTYNGVIDLSKVDNFPFLAQRGYQPHTVKFSPNSRIYANSASITFGPDKHYLELYQFNNNTGLVSNRLDVTLNEGSAYWVYPKFLEFSDDSRFLYVSIDSSKKTAPFTSTEHIVQYDLSVWNVDSVRASAKVLAKRGVNYSGSVTGFQLGPDRKIYVFTGGSYLSVINLPEKQGDSCDYQNNAILLGGKVNNAGGPYYPNFWFKKLEVNLGKDTALCFNDSLVLYSRAGINDKILWSTGDTTNNIVVSTTGVYWVTVQHNGDTASDTIDVQVYTKPAVSIGADTTFCGLFSHVLNAGYSWKKHNWSTGDTTRTIIVDTPGYYYVTVKDSNSCYNTDTILIGRILFDSIHVSYDSVGCHYIYLKASPWQKDLNYVWGNGDTGLFSRVEQKGIYIIEARHLYCTYTDSIEVDLLPAPIIDLGLDTIICEAQTLKLSTNERGAYSWNTGSDSSSTSINDTGTYWLTVSRNHCLDADTIVVEKLQLKINFSYDSVNCRYIYLKGMPRQKGVSYIWDHGDTALFTQVENTGTYTLQASRAQCSIQQSETVNLLPMPEVDLGLDTSICSGPDIMLATNEIGEYLWSNGAQTSSITIQDTGLFWLRVNRNKCENIDSVYIAGCEGVAECGGGFFIPNIFTPNEDGLNDVFKVAGAGVDYVEMKIFNRWGALLYHNYGNSKDIGWNGSFKDKLCADGVYFYTVYTACNARKSDGTHSSGTITLFR